MIVRHGEDRDTVRAVTLLRDSREAAGFDDPRGQTGFSFPFVPSYAARLFQFHLNHLDACALVLDVEGRAEGLLLAVASEHPFGPVKLARETVWWIDPAHRGKGAIKMLDAYEAWAAARECTFAGMAGMGKDPEVAKLYRRRDFGVAETHFLKALG